MNKYTVQVIRILVVLIYIICMILDVVTLPITILLTAYTGKICMLRVSFTFDEIYDNTILKCITTQHNYTCINYVPESLITSKCSHCKSVIHEFL